jgi:hypothetical protein
VLRTRCPVVGAVGGLFAWRYQRLGEFSSDLPREVKTIVIIAHCRLRIEVPSMGLGGSHVALAGIERHSNAGVPE